MKRSRWSGRLLLLVGCVVVGGGLLPGCLDDSGPAPSSGDSSFARQQELYDRRMRNEAEANRNSRDHGASPPYPSNQYDAR
jgi:hypothetical protein